MFILLLRYCFRLFVLLLLRTEELEVSPLTNVILIEKVAQIMTSTRNWDNNYIRLIRKTKERNEKRRKENERKGKEKKRKEKKRKEKKNQLESKKFPRCELVKGWKRIGNKELLLSSFCILRPIISISKKGKPQNYFWILWSLTLKWPRYFYSRWCPRGGSMEPAPEKTTFPPEFCNEICTIYVRDIKNHNSAKKKKKINVVPFQNGGQITDFCFESFRFWPNFEKPLSQRNFSMKFGSKKENMNRFTLLK